MPYISVRTNNYLSDPQKSDIKKKLGKAVELLAGKSEKWLMVEISDSLSMWFKGRREGCAMVEVKLYGGASSEDCEAFTAEITSYLAEKLAIDRDRIYVSYFATDHWGYDGHDF